MSDKRNRSEEATATTDTFGATLRAGRMAAGLTQEAAAEKLHVTQSTVSAWEGGTAYPTPGNLVRLARLLNLDAGDLLRRMVDASSEAVPA